MHILLGFILIVTGLLTVTYFSGPKNTPQQSSLPQQSQAQALPVSSPTPDNNEAMITIRNKKTGEVKQVPQSQVSNYTQATQQPKVVQPSEKALKLSAYIFLAVNDDQRNELISKLSIKKDDLKSAITNFALLLDSKPEGMALAEKLVAEDLAKKKSQAESEAILEYHQKEYERLKAEYDSIPTKASNTYIGTQNTDIKPSLSNTSQNTNRYTSNTSNLVDEPVIDRYRGPTTYNAIGNTVYGSDGSSYYSIGSTIYKNDGTTYRAIGNTVYGSDGSTISSIGRSVYDNNGTFYNRIGNTVYGTDGSTATSIGNTLYTWPGR